MQEAADDLQPGIRLEHALPQVAGGVAVRVRRCGVAGAAVLRAPVEGQEEGVLAIQARSHRHLVLADREVHQRPALEGQQRLGLAGDRVLQRAVAPVLALGVLHRLLELAFELQRGGGDAVDEQHQIQPGVVLAAARVRRIRDLWHHPQAVGAVARQGLGVHLVVGPEAAQLQLHPRRLHPVAQHIQRAVALQLSGDRAHQGLLRVLGVLGGELLPALRPGLLQVGDQILGVQRMGGVIPCGRTGQPAIGGHRVDDVLLKLGFPAVRHDAPRN